MRTSLIRLFRHKHYFLAKHNGYYNTHRQLRKYFLPRKYADPMIRSHSSHLFRYIWRFFPTKSNISFPFPPASVSTQHSVLRTAPLVGGSASLVFHWPRRAPRLIHMGIVVYCKEGNFRGGLISRIAGSELFAEEKFRGFSDFDSAKNFSIQCGNFIVSLTQNLIPRDKLHQMHPQYLSFSNLLASRSY